MINTVKNDAAIAIDEVFKTMCSTFNCVDGTESYQARITLHQYNKIHSALTAAQDKVDAVATARALRNGNIDLLPEVIQIPLISLKAIALSRGKTKNHEYYLTKYRMIKLAENVLEKLEKMGDKE